LHKQRRNQLASFFSKSSVRTLENLIRKRIDVLCTRLEGASGSDKEFNLTHALVALTLDVISRVCFGHSYDFLKQDEFAREWYDAMVATSFSAHLLRQYPGVFWVLSFVPQLGSKSTIASMDATEKRRQELVNRVTSVVELHNREEKPPEDGITVFHAMLDAEVPAQEKSIARLVEEAHALTGAGSMTMATALETTLYHLLENPRYMNRLVDELRTAIPNQNDMPPVADLERLPYLTAVLHEGLRLGKSVTHRLARVSPDEEYSYRGVVIPRGVPVGMTGLNTLENSEIFPNPHAFIPDRWIPLDSPEVRRRRKALVVFGGGTRMCIGLNLAWTELYLTVAALVRRFGTRMKMHDVVFERDIKIVADGFNAMTSRESRGLRVMVQ
jgi:cytochrome P450